MVRKPQIIKRLEALSSRIGAVRPSGTRIAAFAVLVVLSLAVVSAVELISERGALLAAQDGSSQTAAEQQNTDEYLPVAEIMPKFKSVPNRPAIPAAISSQLAVKETKTVTIIEFFVDEQGAVNKKLTHIHESSGFEELDKLAMEWANKIEFHPALLYGKPIKAKVRFPLMWRTK